MDNDRGERGEETESRAESRKMEIDSGEIKGVDDKDRQKKGLSFSLRGLPFFYFIFFKRSLNPVIPLPTQPVPGTRKSLKLLSFCKYEPQEPKPVTRGASKPVPVEPEKSGCVEHPTGKALKNAC